MSASVTTDVHCNQCGGWAHYGVAGRAQIGEARQAAKSIGWSFARDGSCLCPKCNGSNRTYWGIGHREGPPTLPRAPR